MKNYFNFSRKDKVGVIVLLCLIVGMTAALNVGYSTFVPDPFDVDQSTIEYLVHTDSTIEEHKAQSAENEPKEDSKTYSLFDFDPNTIGKGEWMKMGFSEKQAQSILNYRSNYGPFEKKEDLQKLYVISDKKYAEIESHILFKPFQEEIKVENQIQLISIELNTASKEELMSLNGIGPVFAERIISYRKRIGGFVTSSQIEEIWIEEEAKEVLKKEVEINPSNVNTININTASKEELKRIPYSNWLVVAEVLKKRSIEKIETLDFLSEDIISKSDKTLFQYYIRFNE